MGMFNTYLDYGMRWIDYFSQCTALPLGYPGCKTAWLFALAVVMSAGMLFFLRMGYHALLRQKADRLKEKRLLERAQVADAETMDKLAWKGDESAIDLPQEDLADKIRESIATKNPSKDQAWPTLLEKE